MRITSRHRWVVVVAFACVAAGACRGTHRAETDPAPALALESLERGQALAAQGLDRLALAEFERAIAINPELTVAYMGAADIYRRQGDYEAAERHYGSAARLEPRNFDAQYFHALTLQLLDRIAEAIRAYLRALSIRPNDFDANLNLATAYLQAGEPAQALPYAERARSLQPGSGPARVNLGAIYAALDRHEEAVIEFQQAAELLEHTPELLLNLADSLGRTGRYAEMANTLTRLLEIDPQSAIGYERLGSAQFRLGQYDEALASFRRATELDPEHYPAYNGVGVCRLNAYLWSNKTDRAALRDAQAAFRRSLQINQNQPRIKELLTRYR